MMRTFFSFRVLSRVNKLGSLSVAVIRRLGLGHKQVTSIGTRKPEQGAGRENKVGSTNTPRFFFRPKGNIIRYNPSASGQTRKELNFHFKPQSHQFHSHVNKCTRLDCQKGGHAPQGLKRQRFKFKKCLLNKLCQNSPCTEA